MHEWNATFRHSLGNRRVSATERTLNTGIHRAPEVPRLLAARAVQGIGAALVAPAALGLLTHAYTEPAARARALGVFQGSTAAGGTSSSTPFRRAKFLLSVE